MRFKDMTVVVTGGGAGMGRAAALRQAGERANVVVAGRRARQLNEVVETITDALTRTTAMPA